LFIIEEIIYSTNQYINDSKYEADKMQSRRKRTILDRKGLIERMLEDTSKTIDSIKYDLEKSIVDYTFVPGKDIIETDESVIVHVDLPGINKKDIDLKLTETKLKVKADFDIELEVEHGSYITIHDKKSGVMRRTVRFPKKVIPDEAEATFENGVLTVEAPKLEKEESFSLKIK
jgi:HSP20 family protein